MSPALNRGLRKLGRTVLQVIAAGGATALVDALANGLSPTARLAVATAWLLLVTFAQNTLETRGTIPTIFPAPGLIVEAPGKAVTKTVGTVTDAVGKVGGTVTAVVTESGQVVGDVVDTAGDVVGDVTGMVGDAVGGVGGAVGDAVGGVGGAVGGVVGGVLGDDDEQESGRG